MERDLDIGRLTTGVEIPVEFKDSIPYMLQVTYTDNQFSHRFIRFEIPSSVDFDYMKQTVQKYLLEKLSQ